MHGIAAGAGQEGRCAGPALHIGGERGQHAVHAFGIGPRSLGLLLGSAKSRGGYHLHGRRDLTRRLDAGDPVAEVFEAGHLGLLGCSGADATATARGTCCYNSTSSQFTAPAIRVPLANLGFVPPFRGVPR